MPVFSIGFLIIIFSNMSLPGTCNFIGELLVFLSLCDNSHLLFGLSALSILIVSIFNLAILTRLVFYQITGFINSTIHDLNICECILFLIFPIYIIIFGIFPNLLITWL